MSYNYTLKYKTFDQWMAEVLVDFQNYDLENFIEPAALIKVAKRVNNDLGLRIFQTKETLIEIEKGRGKLPDDFYVLNFALICDEVTEYTPVPQGTWIEERPLVTPYKETNANPSSCDIGLRASCWARYSSRGWMGANTLRARLPRCSSQ